MRSRVNPLLERDTLEGERGQEQCNAPVVKLDHPLPVLLVSRT